MFSKVATRGGAAVRRRSTRRPPAKAPATARPRRRAAATRARSSIATSRPSAAARRSWRTSRCTRPARCRCPRPASAGPMEIFGAANPDRVRGQDHDPRHRRDHRGLRRLARLVDDADDRADAARSGKELTQTKLDADFYSELRDPKKYRTSRRSRRPPSTAVPATRSASSGIDGNEDFDFYDVADRPARRQHHHARDRRWGR